MESVTKEQPKQYTVQEVQNIALQDYFVTLQKELGLLHNRTKNGSMRKAFKIVSGVVGEHKKRWDYRYKNKTNEHAKSIK